MKFSPWHLNASNKQKNVIPIILISLSEEICFWDVQHVLNNKLERNLRTSQRFRGKNTKNSLKNSNESFAKEAVESNTPKMFQKSENSLFNSGSSILNGINALRIENNISNDTNVINENNKDFENPWSEKIGSVEKPELLSCIKFVGSSAEKIFTNKNFTKFITIDNEGEVYFLQALQSIEENHS